MKLIFATIVFAVCVSSTSASSLPELAHQLSRLLANSKPTLCSDLPGGADTDVAPCTDLTARCDGCRNATDASFTLADSNKKTIGCGNCDLSAFCLYNDEQLPIYLKDKTSPKAYVQLAPRQCCSIQLPTAALFTIPDTSIQTCGEKEGKSQAVDCSNQAKTCLRQCQSSPADQQWTGAGCGLSVCATTASQPTYCALGDERENKLAIASLADGTVYHGNSMVCCKGTTETYVQGPAQPTSATDSPSSSGDSSSSTKAPGDSSSPTTSSSGKTTTSSSAPAIDSMSQLCGSLLIAASVLLTRW